MSGAKTPLSKADWKAKMIRESRWAAFNTHRRLLINHGLSESAARAQAIRDFEATDKVPPPPMRPEPKQRLPDAPFVPQRAPLPVQIVVDKGQTEQPEAAKKALPVGEHTMGPDDPLPFSPGEYPGIMDRRAEMNWIWDHLAVDAVDPATAPSAGAVGYWQECKKNPKSRSAFYTAVYQRLLPSQGVIDALEKFEDDGSNIDSAIDGVERELTNRALEESASRAVTKPEMAPAVAEDGPGVS